MTLILEILWLTVKKLPFILLWLKKNVSERYESTVYPTLVRKRKRKKYFIDFQRILQSQKICAIQR